MEQTDLSHISPDGAARMVDVGGKPETDRVAVAAGTLRTTGTVIGLVRDGAIPKGEVLSTARIAGIMAAKRTAELIPLCHPVPLSAIDVELELADAAITITATARTHGRTGVEMEALTAVAVTGLTLHDMIKAVDPAAVLDGVRLLTKTGGRSGDWTRP